MKTPTTLFVVGMFLMPAAMADDVDDVKAALQRSQVATNTGDANSEARILLEGYTRFGFAGGLLERFDLEEARKNRQAAFDAGLKFNVQDRHIEVSVYGNSTAVATSYRVGTITQPNGNTVRPNNRITTVLIKQGGQWKMVHQHVSPVRLPQ